MRGVICGAFLLTDAVGKFDEILDNKKVLRQGPRPTVGVYEVEPMMRLPFSRKPTGDDGKSADAAFREYCGQELERRRDSGAELDEARFQAAVDLAVGRLREMGREKKA